MGLRKIEYSKLLKKNYSIISEEDGSKINSDSENVWIIDPIDGTSNFLHGIPHFAISIALKSNNEIISGLIYDPIKDEMFYAEKNSGAYFNNQRIKVSKKKEIENCLFATGGKEKIISDFMTRKTGCAALDMAYVAAGRYDGYFQNNLNLWDVAAGIIIIKEAGGIINEIEIGRHLTFEELSTADIIITDFGRPKWIKKNMVKDQVIIIDAANNYVNGKVIGDADMDELLDKVDIITPVPGGLGPILIANLIKNLVKAAEIL